jgi:Zn finger protein HypA/HybF involved in hydrogenase expression
MEEGTIPEEEEIVPEEEIQKLTEIFLRSEKKAGFNQKEATRLLNERERLKFYCEGCSCGWTQWRPIGYAVRSGDDTNFFIPIEGEPAEDGIRTYVRCPECGKTKKIRRMNVIKISSHNPAKRRSFTRRPVVDEEII